MLSVLQGTKVNRSWTKYWWSDQIPAFESLYRSLFSLKEGHTGHCDCRSISLHQFFIVPLKLHCLPVLGIYGSFLRIWKYTMYILCITRDATVPSTFIVPCGEHPYTTVWHRAEVWAYGGNAVQSGWAASRWSEVRVLFPGARGRARGLAWCAPEVITSYLLYLAW